MPPSRALKINITRFMLRDLGAGVWYWQPLLAFVNGKPMSLSLEQRQR